jgi:hypothetical protein
MAEKITTSQIEDIIKFCEKREDLISRDCLGQILHNVKVRDTVYVAGCGTKVEFPTLNQLYKQYGKYQNQ